MPDIYLSSRPGLTITAQLYTGADAVGAPIPMTEIATSGEYFADIPYGTGAARYVVVYYYEGMKLASGVMDWDGLKEVQISDYGRVLEQIQTRLDAEFGAL